MKTLKKLSALFLCFLIFALSAVSASAAVTDAETPVSPEEAKLIWSLKLGSSYRDAPSVPVVYGGYVFSMSRNKLYKISTQSGEIMQSAEMSSEPSFSYTPVSVADNKIFCPLEGGVVQAFGFETMQSLWAFTDTLGGQALSPIVYDDGCVYTGFWDDEELDANFVCIDAENGELKWSYTLKGGFYWAECAVVGDYLVVGGDNGSAEAEEYAALHCFNKKTGELIDSAQIIGDQRSGVALYEDSLYFVTKAGYLYKAELNENGCFASVKNAKLSGASTSTPVLHNGRIYVGVQSQGFSGNISVLDSESLNLVYEMPMNGYPQSEVLVSTAYDDVYVYSTYNAGPGGITVITDGAAPVSQELFTPEDGSRSYCISPISADENGTLFYKNDSGTIFAVGKSEPQSEKTLIEIIVEWLMGIINIILSLFG